MYAASGINYFTNYLAAYKSHFINQLRFNGVYYVTRQNNTRDSVGCVNGNVFARKPRGKGTIRSICIANY